MSEVVIIGIFALLTSIATIGSPLVLFHMTSNANRTSKVEDWKREDAVAAKAAEAAKLLLQANAEVAAAARVTNQKLDVIHTLVNSNLTAAMQSEYDATFRELILMKEIVKIKQKDGHDPSKETLDTVAVTEAKLAELQAKLTDRMKAQATIDAQISPPEVVTVIKAPDPLVP